jgi:hypothetical protein
LAELFVESKNFDAGAIHALPLQRATEEVN